MPDIDSIVYRAVDSAVNRITNTLAREVASVKKKNAELKRENVDLKSSLRKIEARVAKGEEAADLSEQYSCRNCVRISGVQEENNEDTERMVQNMATDLNVNLPLTDIDRCNRVGKPRVGRQCPIMLKFATYIVRQSLYMKRLDLRDKDSWSNVFIDENLTGR